MEQIRTISEDVGAVRAQERPVPRGRRARGGPARDLGLPVKWIETPRAPRHRAARLVGDAEMELAVDAEGVLLGVRMRACLNSGAYPWTPFPGAMMVGTSARCSRADEARGDSRPRPPPGGSATRATLRVVPRPVATGRTSCAERVLDIIGKELGIGPARRPPAQLRAPRRGPLGHATGQPFTGRVHHQESIEQAARIVGWRRLQGDPHARAREEEAATSGWASASYPRGAAPDPRTTRDRGQERGGDLGTRPGHVSWSRPARSRSSPSSTPHGRATRPTWPRSAWSDRARRAVRAITVKYGDTDITPFALVSTGGSRAARWPTSVLHASRTAARERSPAIAGGAARRPHPQRPQINDAVVNVVGSPASRCRGRDPRRVVAEEPDLDADPRASTAELTERVTSTTAARAAGPAAPHCCFVEVDVETGMVGHLAVRGGGGLRPAGQPGDRRGPRSEGCGPGRSAQCCSSRRLQRRGPVPRQHLHGLPAADHHDVPNLEIHHLESVLADPDVNLSRCGRGRMIVAPAAIVSANRERAGHVRP